MLQERGCDVYFSHKYTAASTASRKHLNTEHSSKYGFSSNVFVPLHDVGLEDSEIFIPSLCCAAAEAIVTVSHIESSVLAQLCSSHSKTRLFSKT